MRLATWNINSVRLRLPQVLDFLNQEQPDVLCLQEIKVEDEKFPADALAEAGWAHQAIFGMKSYHGVATISRLPFASTERLRWCQKEDARHIAVTLEDGTEIHNLYIPAGGDEPDPEINEKFAHKLQFFREQTAYWQQRAKTNPRAILVGDLNVAPSEHDVWSHQKLLKVVSHTPIEVSHYEAMVAAGGWVDAVRACLPEPEVLYSWWSYRARDWRAADKGRRLDHVWVTPPLAAGVQQARILKDVRGWEKASDHAPIVVDIEGV